MTPLQGLRILDFSTLLPGPFCTVVLSDLGAEVIRLEAPDRTDLLREYNPTGHRTINRNKRSIAIDLKQAGADQFVIETLLPNFDILVEQFRPGVMQRLGLDYESLKSKFPKLIYCSISGYGQNNRNAHRAAHDLNLVARSGMASYGSSSDLGPEIPSNQWADIGGGSMYAMVAILSAVIERQRSGLGQHLDVSMLHGSLNNQLMYAAEILDNNATVKPRSQVLNGGSLYGYYRCRDGRFLAIASLETHFLKELSNILELPDLLKTTNQSELKSMISNKIVSHDYATWLKKFENSNCCVDPVLSLEEALEENPEQVIQLQDGSRQLAHPVKFSRSTLNYTHSGCPAGQHTIQVLKEFRLSDIKLDELKKQGIIRLPKPPAD